MTDVEQFVHRTARIHKYVAQAEEFVRHIEDTNDVKGASIAARNLYEQISGMEWLRERLLAVSVGFRRFAPGDFPLIGLAGAARVGKDTCAGHLRKMFLRATSEVQMAAVLKRMADVLLDGLGVYQDDKFEALPGITRNASENRRLYTQTDKERVIPQLGKSYRQLLQLLGTEFGRDMIGPDLWIKTAQVAVSNLLAPVVITDVRFPNELDFVYRNNGVILFLERNHGITVCEHSSEVSLKPLLDPNRSRVVVNEDSSHPASWAPLIHAALTDLWQARNPKQS